MRLPRILACLILPALLPSCNTAKRDAEANALRNTRIAVEPSGDFYYARRYYIPKTRFWGYLRKPRQPWSSATMVIMDESRMNQPDRFPEYGSSPRHGFDHNYEYIVYGKYTGKFIYDPNTDLVLPAFQITNYKLVNSSPGFLFRPSERYSTSAITLRPDPAKPVNSQILVP